MAQLARKRRARRAALGEPAVLTFLRRYAKPLTLGGVAGFSYLALRALRTSGSTRGLLISGAQRNQALVRTEMTEAPMIGNVLFDAAKKQQLDALLANAAIMVPGHSRPVTVAGARQYLDEIVRVAGEEQVSPFLLTAVLWQESNFGAALKPPGPAGTGDFTARRGHWVGAPHTQTFPDAASLPPGWRAPPGPGPYAIPDDGRGFGRGLGQDDYVSGDPPANSYDWTNPYLAISYMAKLLAKKQRLVASLVSRGGGTIGGNDLAYAAVSAYNHGEGAVATAWLALVAKANEAGVPPDIANLENDLKGDYAKPVMALATGLEQAFAAA